jgi:DNA-binding winged helix-turn-helix (wHTH) protein/TolB-like protein/Tfp pilus assembly protein PilF
MSGATHGRIYEFGSYRLDASAQVLYAKTDGRQIPLTARVYDTLLFLVEHPHELLDKRRLMSAIWPNLVVEENNLDQKISALRQLLGERRGENQYIVTVRGRGYRFVAPVSVATALPAAAESPPAATALPVPAESPPAAADAPPVQPAAPPAAADQRGRRRAIVGAVAVAVIVAAVAAWISRSPDPASPSAEPPRLAVLPFRPLALAERSESLELGMTETLIAGLSTEGLAVQPLSAVRRFAPVEQDALLAGRELAATAVLEGYIQRDRDRLRVSVQLLEVPGGRQLWAARYDEPFTDIFSVQDAIAARVRTALLPHLREQPPALRRYTQDPEAYQLYVNGRFHREAGTEAGLQRALEYFEQATERDPHFAEAYAGLAEAYSTMGVFGTAPPREVFPRAQEAVAKAIELAPALGAAYASLGHIKMQYEHDWRGAETALRRALDLDPNYASAHQFLGLRLAESGRFHEGLEHLRRAAALEPSRPTLSALVGMVLIYDRRYDEAIEQLEATLEMNAALPTAHTYLALAHLRRGDYDEAARHLTFVQTPTPGSFGYAGQAHALAGRRAEALAEAERLIALARERYVPAYDIATIYASLGETEPTFLWLERAFDDKSTLIAWLPWDAVFDGIRADPRYSAMEARLGVDARR